ncbi:hypothetical protein TRFO_13052 [Tritrichomonas foetus]|uniref:Uncharacterized protein n=1 Tax=Tritrichomonas foetus TaxID=1144522 RepID=A0A1J4KZE7_9EUKA|nr:hypothetical protein TRFO_13052 [Tritrichomonas foetus]|eukprot:OHT16631.1 hypothetical protein TRFO_13052 [Tritrichomonas foetus]
MTVLKAQQLLEKIPTISACFEKLLHDSQFQPSDLEKIKDEFETYVHRITDLINNYQRSKTGEILQLFNQIADVFTRAYDSNCEISSIEKLHIRLQVIPIFNSFNQYICLSSEGMDNF